MNLYLRYLGYLRENGNVRLSRKIIFELPHELLRNEYSNDSRRAKGIFFTNKKLAKLLLQRIGKRIDNDRVYDPAAGGGDLLLAYADTLSSSGDLQEVLKEWGQRIYATEIEGCLIPLIRLRLMLLAYLKVEGNILLKDIDLDRAATLFENIKGGDFRDYCFDVDTIVVNPPFNTVKIESVSWATGNVSNAAVFLYELDKRYHTSVIGAILPDVLRSGSRYGRLRAILGRYYLGEEKPVGRFDQYTDVDVFIAVSKAGYAKAQKGIEDSQLCIGDLFDVKVGCVVPHRDSIEGNSHYYLTARSIMRGKEHHVFQDKIQSAHKPVKGPFIAIKRTSSPSDKTRCAASLIVSNDYFHLENHLISLKAKKPMALTRYRTMLQFLNSQKCTDFLNQAIRCRHLTVPIIKQIPIKE